MWKRGIIIKEDTQMGSNLHLEIILQIDGYLPSKTALHIRVVEPRVKEFLKL